MITIGRAFQIHGNIVALILLLTFGHVLRVTDIFVVGDSSVLVLLQVEVVVHRMKVVSVSAVTGEDASVIIGCPLIGVIATPIEVIEVEPECHTLVHIGREISLETVLTDNLIACFIVSKVGIRDIAIGEIHLTGSLEEETRIRLQEKLRIRTIVALTEQSGESGRAQVAQMVVMPVVAFSEVIQILIVQCNGIHGDAADVSQRLIDVPHVEFRRQALYLYAVITKRVELTARVHLITKLIHIGSGIQSALGKKRKGADERQQQNHRE